MGRVWDLRRIRRSDFSLGVLISWDGQSDINDTPQRAVRAFLVLGRSIGSGSVHVFLYIWVGEGHAWERLKRVAIVSAM